MPSREIVFSSQWAKTGISSLAASLSASRISSAVLTGTPSSEKAQQPASFKACISVSFSPFSPTETAPIGRTWASALAAFSSIYFTVSALSHTGFVLGMAQTVVTPPAAAARHPEIISSLYSRPGSRKCTCKSISPGAKTSPEASMILSAEQFKALPKSAILPSTTRTSPTVSSFCEGSITCAFLNSKLPIKTPLIIELW